MSESIFNPEHQHQDPAAKVVAGLQRISEAFKVLLWEQAKQLGLSPVQIQILIFLAYHKRELCTVSHLAQEFNITKPTVSDAVRVLHNKGFVMKDHSPEDQRSYVLVLTDKGKETVSGIEHFAEPIKSRLNILGDGELSSLFSTISTLIFQLNKAGVLSVQRTCYGCSFFEKKSIGNYCNLLEQKLRDEDIRIDCPEFEAVS